MTGKKKAKKKELKASKEGLLSFKFIDSFITELRKVVWPTREEAIRLSLIVLAVSIAVGIFLGVIDYSFTQLAKLFF